MTGQPGTADIRERRAAYDEWIQGLFTAQRHGAGDGLGSLNYIDAAARRRGCEAMSTGVAISLARDLAGGPTVRHDGGSAFEMELFETNIPAVELDIRSDRIVLDCHGLANTHIDALNHMGFRGSWYVDPDAAAGSGSIGELARFGIFTRAVYVDVAAVRGQPYVAVEHPVTAEDIETALAESGVQFQPGDALLIDCGRDRFDELVAPWSEQSARPGVGESAGRWLADNQPGLLCWDMLDAFSDAQVNGSIHRLHWAIGLVLVDNCDFARLRPAMVNRPPIGALVVAPLCVAGATGSNVNPLLLV